MSLSLNIKDTKVIGTVCSFLANSVNCLSRQKSHQLGFRRRKFSSLAHCKDSVFHLTEGKPSSCYFSGSAFSSLQRNLLCHPSRRMSIQNSGIENKTIVNSVARNEALSPDRSRVLDNELIVASFYKFAELEDYESMRQPIRELCEKNLISGGIILAGEGINGSLCGTRVAIETVFATLRRYPRLADISYRESPAGADEVAIHGQTNTSPLSPGPDAPFRWDHVRVKLKQEIVSMGVPGVDPSKEVGTYVSPEEWNQLLKDPETMVIDVRNTYEIRIGKFKGALDPCTDSFRQFPGWVEETLEPSGSQSVEESEALPTEPIEGSESESSSSSGEKRKPKRLAMYCTGGIRCEKATSFMLAKGFDEVYHLKGGILRYLDEVPPEQSLWEGECFVFDKRVSVSHGLQPGTHSLCYACKQPVTDEDMESELWEEGVSCPYCFHARSEEEKERARARQAQFEMWGVVGGPDRGRRPNASTKQKKGLQEKPSDKQN